MDLGGAWRAARADDTLRRQFPQPGFDDDGWEAVDVPGHWRDVPAFGDSDGPLLYRRRFSTPEPAGPDGRRHWLCFEGVFYQGDVWLDGLYVGDTEGYFVPHAFEVTDAVAGRCEHTLAVEVACTPPSDRTAKRNLTGVFEHWDCIDESWNPGGIWAPVRLHSTGAVRIATLRVLCTDANAERATLDLAADLDAADATAAAVDITVTGPDGRDVAGRRVDETLAAGTNRVRWRLTVDRPGLWWPHALGEPALHDVTVRVDVGATPSDERRVTTGLRQVRMRRHVTTVNGERLFLKGTNLGPVRRALGAAGPAECRRDVDLARQAGLDLLRIHGHITRPEVYDAADRAGMLVWQDLPLQWGYTNVRRQAVRQAAAAVDLLGHHPSVARWCGHNEPLALDVGPGRIPDGAARRRYAVGQALPSFNRTVLDGSIKRALERADPSRPVAAHSGVLPHPAGGTDTHLYCGWYHGDSRDLPRILARFPVLARFVSEFGAQAVPDTNDWMDPRRWPDLDWDRLGRAHALQKEIFDQRVPPGDHPDFDAWRLATQEYQADLLRHHVETLRRLKYRPTGGFCQFLWADAQPAVSWSVLDHERRPKLGYHALAAACAPVIVTAERPDASYAPGARVRLGVHAVSDRRVALGGAVTTAVLSWPGGHRTWRWTGDVGADSCAFVGAVDAVVPTATGPGELVVDVELRWSDGTATNRYLARVTPASQTRKAPARARRWRPFPRR